MGATQVGAVDQGGKTETSDSLRSRPLDSEGTVVGKGEPTAQIERRPLETSRCRSFSQANEIPEQSELAALKDRFCLKAESQSVQEQHFTELVDMGVEGEVHKVLNQKPWSEGHCTLDDLLKANRYLTYLFARKHRSGRGQEQNDREVFFPPEVFDEFRRLVKTLTSGDKIFISDRKLVKLYKLFRIRAWLFSGGTVTRDDLRLLAYLGESHQEVELLRQKVPMLPGLE